jgi:hypothetical protein
MIYEADQLEAALRANLALIEDAQRLLTTEEWLRRHPDADDSSK